MFHIHVLQQGTLFVQIYANSWLFYLTNSCLSYFRLPLSLAMQNHRAFNLSQFIPVFLN